MEKGEIIWSKKSWDYPLKRFSCKKWNACLSYFSTDLEVLNVNQPNVFLRQARAKNGVTPLLLKTFPRDDFSSKYEENFFLKICIKFYYKKVPAVLAVLNICIGFINQGILKGGSITLLLTSCLTGLESAVWQLTIFVLICKTD